MLYAICTNQLVSMTQFNQDMPKKNQLPDRTFIRDGVFHRQLSNVRNQVWNDGKVKALEKANEPGQREAGDIFSHVRPGETEITLTEDDLDLIAFYDGMPGCYNFRYLHRKLTREVKRSKRYNRPTSVVIVGVDGFANVEMSFGPLAADTVVFSVIEFLLAGVRTDVDMVGRLADDRYVLVLPETPGRGATILADRLRKQFESLDLRHNWHKLPITLSFGIAYFPGHGEDPRELIARADLACEFVQERGGNGFAFAPEG